jgi:hypothetical protein
MSKGPQKIRGTQDIWGEAADRFQTVVEAFDRVRRLYGFRRVEMPVFEATEVFARSIGETTDIVSKEMYSFEDRGGDGLTLRPEFTAGICRAFLSEGWQQLTPVKIATHGPAFRYERPQKGRYRQFHQLDAEIIGAGEPAADVSSSTPSAIRPRAMPGAPLWSRISGHTGTTSRRKAASGSRRIRSASSTARSIRTGRSSTPRRWSTISSRSRRPIISRR